MSVSFARAPGLKRAIERLEEITPRVAHPRTRRGWEALNLCQAGLLVARWALAREESRAPITAPISRHDDANF